MTVIAASSVRVTTLVDGTLRITADVEPRHAQDAFRLFGAPGVPMALAALKPARAEPEKTLGPLAMWAVMRCQDPKFRAWLTSQSMHAVEDEEQAKAVICNTCGIQSRKELDTNGDAAAIFSRKVREPYKLFLQTQGEPA